MIKATLVILLMTFWALATFGQLPPLPENSGLFSQPTSDPRITAIHYYQWGAKGDASVFGPPVPQGQVWLLETIGISTDGDGRYLEYMMQKVVYTPNGVDDHWLIPLHRNNGFAGGTPVLAVPRRVILTAGQALSARTVGITRKQRMGLLFEGWAFHEDMLPFLLGCPPR